MPDAELVRSEAQLALSPTNVSALSRPASCLVRPAVILKTEAGNMTRNQRIINMVSNGMSYSAVAHHLGISRNAVAGVCGRAGVRMEPHAIARNRSKAAQAHMLRQWQDPRLRELRTRAAVKGWQNRMEAN